MAFLSSTSFPAFELLTPNTFEDGWLEFPELSPIDQNHLDCRLRDLRSSTPQPPVGSTPPTGQVLVPGIQNSATPQPSNLAAALQHGFLDPHIPHRGGVTDVVDLNSVRPAAKRPAAKDNSGSGDGNKQRRVASDLRVLETVTPTKHPSDLNRYRVITLSNGLIVVLIQTAKISSDGSSSQPPGSQGLGQDSIWKLIGSSGVIKSYRCRESEDNRNSLLWDPLGGLPSFFSKTNDDLAAWIRLETTIPDENNNIRGRNPIPIPLPATPRARAQVDMDIATVVNVGSMNDPGNCHGLAHFTEHMVHYGSTKFPKENEYLSFLSLGSYNWNAFTESDTTTYFNCIREGFAEKGIDMMANMLSDPLFERSMTEREVKSVDSEFHLKRHNFYLRRRLLFQTCFEDHPIGNFGCGNEETLLEPKNIHDVLKKFHQNFYHAGAMTFGVECDLTLNMQQQLVLDYLGGLQRGTRHIVQDTPVPAKSKSPLKENDLFNMDYIMKGTCSISNLWVAWPVPVVNTRTSSRFRTFSVLGHLLSAESEGTLSKQLKDRGYIWRMVVRNPIDSHLMRNKYSGFFAIEFFLTTEGQAHVEEIMSGLYGYIEKLKTLLDATLTREFEIMKRNEERNFQFGEFFGTNLEPPTAVSCATALQHVRPQDILMNEWWAWQDATFQPGELRQILDLLKPSEMNVIQTLPGDIVLENYAEVEEDDILTAPYTDAEYMKQEITERFEHLNLGKFNFSQAFQHENPYAAGLQVKPPCVGLIERQNLQIPPVRYFKVLAARHLGNPPDKHDGFCYISLESHFVNSNARHLALALLWITSTMLSLSAEYNQAGLAGVRFAVFPTSTGIILRAAGFPEKLMTILGILMDRLYSEEMRRSNHEAAKNALNAYHDLFYADHANLITRDLMDYVTCMHSKDPQSDYLLKVMEASYEEVCDFRHLIKRDAAAKIVVGGNLPLSSGNEIAQILNRQEQFQYGGILMRQDISYSPNVKIRPQERCIRMKTGISYNHTNTVTNFYYVGRYTPSDYFLWSNSLLLFKMKAFEHLRMTKQLTYAPQAGFPRGQIYQPIVLTVSVTSTATKFSPCELDQEIDSFMFEYGKFLATLSPKEFEELKRERGTESQVSIGDATKWYRKHFGEEFTRKNRRKYAELGMGKLSVQILSKDCKECQCQICNKVGGWKRNKHWNLFHFAQDKEDATERYFIDDPKKMRDDGDF